MLARKRQAAEFELRRREGQLLQGRHDWWILLLARPRVALSAAAEHFRMATLLPGDRLRDVRREMLYVVVRDDNRRLVVRAAAAQAVVAYGMSWADVEDQGVQLELPRGGWYAKA